VMTDVEIENMWHLFHNLWTRDVGTPGYDKEKWISLEAHILKLKADRAELYQHQLRYGTR
jgi:hypothetical protein